uniref:Uncharacterized LOC100486588 n=1 Tax=Xenopus tropicalis TaxID=8364 RepID=A0A803J2W9_XENTR
MEKTDDDPLQETQFWCNICRITCASALNLQSHFMGFKHRQVEESLKNNGAVDDPEPAVAGQTLDDLLRACKETEPALGLEYVYEYHQDESSYRAYECRLCNLQTGLAHMFMHVVGAKHRIAYLSKHHSTLGIPSTFQVKSSTKNKKLKDACFTVEKTFGRKSINIAKGSFEPRSFLDGPLPASALNYGTDNKLKQIDFTTDDFGDIDKKPSVSERVVTFRDEWLQVDQGANGAEAEAPPAPAQDPQLPDDEAVAAPQAGPAALPPAPAAPPGACDAASQTGGTNLFLDLLQEVRQEMAQMSQNMALMSQDIALIRHDIRDIQEAVLAGSPPPPSPFSPPPPAFI